MEYQVVSTAKDAFKKSYDNYEKNNLELPEVVYWSTRSSRGAPLTKNQKGVCAISGFSTNILEEVL